MFVAELKPSANLLAESASATFCQSLPQMGYGCLHSMEPIMMIAVPAVTATVETYQINRNGLKRPLEACGLLV